MRQRELWMVCSTPHARPAALRRLQASCVRMHPPTLDVGSVLFSQALIKGVLNTSRNCEIGEMKRTSAHASGNDCGICRRGSSDSRPPAHLRQHHHALLAQTLHNEVADCRK